VTVCGQVNHTWHITNTHVHSAFRPSGVGKPSTDLFGWGKGGPCSPVWLAGNTVGWFDASVCAAHGRSDGTRSQGTRLRSSVEAHVIGRCVRNTLVSSLSRC